VTSFALAPDQDQVVYRADQRRDGVFELFAAPLAGGPVVALDTLPDFADVASYRIDPDSRHVVYLADGLADGRLELFAAPLDPGGERRLRALPGPGGLRSR
jgi:hypothetical protein